MYSLRMMAYCKSHLDEKDLPHILVLIGILDTQMAEFGVFSQFQHRSSNRMIKMICNISYPLPRSKTGLNFACKPVLDAGILLLIDCDEIFENPQVIGPC